MREFAFGTTAQFSALDQELSQGKKYKFDNRQLPDCCSQTRACVWFAKVGNVYHIYISKGISANTENQNFNNFLERGEAKFICIEDMMAFLHSLQTLFGPEGAEKTKKAASEESRVLDKKKLEDIKIEAESRMVWPEELAVPLKKKIYGQDDVLDALADIVVINRIRKDKKLLVITLMGPTATGKSETAKTLAEVMTAAYGTNYGFIEISGSEFAGEHTVSRFLGAPPGFVGYGNATILDPVRENPHHIIVLNEIEKADKRILVGLMEAFDTGKLGMADNSEPIDLNQCILLLTSNVQVDTEKYLSCTEFERSEMCRDVFTKFTGYPEISGKIGNFLVFNPLNDESITDIIIKFVREELSAFNLTLSHIDEYLMADFLEHRTKYGARGIRELVSNSVGRHLLRVRKLEKFRGKKVSMSGTVDCLKFAFEGGENEKG